MGIYRAPTGLRLIICVSLLQQESPEGVRYDPDQSGGGGSGKAGSSEAAEEARTRRAGAGSRPGSDRQSSGGRGKEL